MTGAVSAEPTAGPHGGPPVDRPAVLRVAVLLAVLFGLFGMHGLTAGHGDAGHGSLPVSSGSGHGSAHQARAGIDHLAGVSDGTGVMAAAQADVFPPSSASPGNGDEGSAGLAACLLFLAVGSAIVALALVAIGRSRDRVDPASPVRAWLRRRGPPERPPQSRLCVMRV